MKNADQLKLAVTEGAQVDLPTFLEWLGHRMVKVYGENPNIDFVQTCFHRAKRLRAALEQSER